MVFDQRFQTIFMSKTTYIHVLNERSGVNAVMKGDRISTFLIEHNYDNSNFKTLRKSEIFRRFKSNLCLQIF